MFPAADRFGSDWEATLNRLSPLEVARWFHSIGCNVFPLRYGTKNGFPYPWGRLTYTRLPAEALRHLFAGPCNLAVMMGAISANMFVLDCETSMAFQTCIYELEQRRIPVCAVQTVRGGHLYLRAVGVVRNIPCGTMPDIEVRGSDGYVLVPPSMHPSGHQYRFYRWDVPHPPVVDLCQLDFLRDNQCNPVRLQSSSPQRSYPVSAHARLTVKTRDYLTHGGAIAEGSRNLRLFSAATDLLGCGFGIAETTALLTPVAARSGLSLLEIQRTLHNASRQPRQSHKLLHRSQSFIEGDLPAQPTHTGISPQVEALWAFAMHAAVSAGRHGESERRILLAMVALYKRGANPQGIFRGSQREWLELAHLSDYHASEKALQRLQQLAASHQPVLRLHGTDKLSGARLWQIEAWVFAEGERLLRESTARAASVGGTDRLEVDTLNNADYLERGALGINGYRIYASLCGAGKPLSLKQIAEHIQLSVDTVRYHLREERPLRQQGLVQIHGAKRNRTYSAAPVSHDELNNGVAVACDTAGKSEARQKNHQRERSWFMAGLIVRRMGRIWNSYHQMPRLPSSNALITCRDVRQETAPPFD
jgi:hypothetical protein